MVTRVDLNRQNCVPLPFSVRNDRITTKNQELLVTEIDVMKKSLRGGEYRAKLLPADTETYRVGYKSGECGENSRKSIRGNNNPKLI
jgi:hypothetical protein